jgi:hypothetical protein
MVNLNITPHMRSILARNYQQLLTDPEITALNPQTPPLRYNPAKGVHGKRKDKITWSYTVSQYPDILANYEAQLSIAAEEAAPDSGGDQHPPQRQNPPNPLKQQTPSTPGN